MISGPACNPSLLRSKMPRSVAIANEHSKAKVSLASAIAVIQTLDRMRAWRCPQGELSVVFLGDKAIAKIHADFLDDPTVTDVITFIGEDHPVEPFAGEICINVDQAKRAAKEHGTSVEHELRLYLAHGWLHLAGLLDSTKAQAAKMRAAEVVALKHLDKAKVCLKVTV